MSERGADFLVSWVESNIGPGASTPEVDAAAAQAKASECLTAAEANGLTASELEAEVGPLAAYMRVMMTAPNEDGLVQVNFEDEPRPDPSTRPSG